MQALLQKLAGLVFVTSQEMFHLNTIWAHTGEKRTVQGFFFFLSLWANEHFKKKKKSNFRVQQSLPRVHSLLFSLEFKEFPN